MKNNPGASLGPGPKAGPDGVKDNYYVKKYYKENPKSFTVVKPTDLIMDYLKDIKQLLKGE